MDIEKKNAILAAIGSPLRNVKRKLNLTDDTPKFTRTVDKLVFQPNVFGWPSNDIDVMNNTTNPEVKIALERRNLKISAENGVEDDDVALDTLKHNDETENEYFDRMQPLINEAKNSMKSKNS